MKNILFVTGHGKYASLIKTSIEFLAGGNEEIEYIDFTEDDNDATLKDKMREKLNEHKQDKALFICDILGGTPFKCAAELSLENENIEVIAGCNVGSIIEAIFQKDTMDIGTLADFVINSSKNSTGRFVKKFTDNNSINEEASEGI
ncbi:PTS fructose transporter subunit IIA [Clostridium neuense]|uniref:PTS fructose transporter subunit IIA n=1 Tax=Clostridium neuense TaxID=1728934 RepID=A0ABW8TLB3_9CLOT